MTGSLVAKAIKADLYENWTDVSGFLVTDPRIVKNPEVIESITYRELRELSYMGATVLHEDAIFPVRKEGIPINIKNTNRPEDKGTFIVESTCKKPKFTITGIAGKKGKMKKIVKFGGSSLANAEQFQKVGEIIRSDESRRYVVPSAPGKRFDGDTKVTDLLYKCYNTAVEGEDFVPILQEIKGRYYEIIRGLNLDLSLEDEFVQIEADFRAQAGTDYAASRGEFLNGKVMAAYLGYEFVDAADVIRFDKNGNLDAEKTDRLLSKKLAKCERAVIPGFYGAGEDGKV